MKKSTIITFLLCFPLVAAIGASAQKTIRIPDNEVLPMIAVQEDCPLKIDRFAVVSEEHSRFAMVYSVRNISSKNVISYRIMRTYDTGTGFVEYGVMPLNKLLPPGQTTGTIERVTADGEESHYKGELKALAFIMVVEVTFEDGTIFSAKPLLDAFDDRLKKYRLP